MMWGVGALIRRCGRGNLITAPRGTIEIVRRRQDNGSWYVVLLLSYGNTNLHTFIKIVQWRIEEHKQSSIG